MVEIAFLVFLCGCQHLWHPVTTAGGISKFFNACQYPAFTNGYGGASVVLKWSPRSSTWLLFLGITAVQV
jgi:hypothetical protein